MAIWKPALLRLIIDGIVPYRQFNNNHSMCELVLPIGTSQEEIKCIQAIARSLGMDTTLGNEVRH